MIETDVSCTLNRKPRSDESRRDIVGQRIAPGRAGCLHVELLQHLDRQRVAAGISERDGAIARTTLRRQPPAPTASPVRCLHLVWIAGVRPCVTV